VVKNLFERLERERPPAEEPIPQQVPPPTPPEALKLLNWLQHNWGRNVICARDLYRYGPHRSSGRESALKAAEILEKRGWFIPLKANRRDVKRWQITIGP
jgi:hypothetical protein